VEQALQNDLHMSNMDVMRLMKLNPDYWKGYQLTGDYYFKNKRFSEALQVYTIALEKEVPTVPDRKYLSKQIKKSKRKANR